MTVVLDRGLGLWLMSIREYKVRILLAEQVLVGDVLPEVVHLPQGDSFNEEREVSIAQ